MAGFENQPTMPASRKQRNSTFSEESSSEISSPIDLKERLRRERTSRKETDEVYQRLQDDYDELLKKYAQAENTIDQLKIGAKLNLYSDLPPPQQSSVVNVSVHRQPGVLRFPRSNQAVLSNGEVLGGGLQSFDADSHQNGDNRRTNTSSNNVNFHNLTPDGRAESLREALSFKVQSFQEDVDALQDHVMEGRWGEPELKELRDICEQLRLQNEDLKHELDHARQIEGNNDESFTGDFLPEDSLEGQLYRCSLRLEEIKDQLGDNNPVSRVQDKDARMDSYSELLNRPRDNHQEAIAEESKPDSELQNLMQRLRNIKEASGSNELRDGNSSDDVEDLDLNSVGQTQEYSRRFSLGPFPDSDEEEKQGLGDLAEPPELQESGYFASESMSVINDPASEPLSNRYFANSQELRSRSPRGSLIETRPQRPSVTSTGTFSQGQRSRSASHRSHADTADVDSVLEDGRENDTPSFVLASTSPVGSQSPQVSPSSVRDDTGGIPRPQHRDSRFSEAGSRRSRANSYASRLPEAGVVSNHDSLRNPGTARGPDDSFLSRDYTASPRSSPRESRVSQNPRESFASRGRTSSTRSTGENPLIDVDARKSSKVTSGRHPFKASVSGDSRVSTPLFLPNSGTGIQPNGFHGRNKHRLGPVDTERGFDSGFFGSEGSRISRGQESPEIPPRYSYSDNKLSGAPLQEQSETETEGERLSTTTPKVVPKSVPRIREQRRRRSHLQLLSESDEDKEREAPHSKASVRTPSSQRERRSHRHTPTHPGTRSENEGIRRSDDNLRRHMSSPSLFDPGPRERPRYSGPAGRDTRSPSRQDASITPQRSGGPRSDQGRSMDKQSVRSYPGDRDSVRSGRRSGRGCESSSGYSDNERRYRRDPLDKLREELQRMRDQLQQEANRRDLQAQMYDDLRRRHDDLEREMSQRSVEQQMATMYDNLRKKYDALASDISRENKTDPSLYEDLRKRLDELAIEVEKIKQKDNERPPPSSSFAATDPVSTVRFLCPFCGGSGSHSHEGYFYPGYAGPRDSSPIATVRTPPRAPRHAETQTPYKSRITNTFIGQPATPTAASTPYYPNALVSSPLHQHTHTYPGVVTHPSVTTGTPLVHSAVATDTPTIHHIHHMPGEKNRLRRTQRNSDSDESASDEDVVPRTRSIGRVRLRKHPGSPNSWGSRHEDELESYRLHQSLDEANRAARRMQRLSKKMLGSIASDLIRSGKR